MPLVRIDLRVTKVEDVTTAHDLVSRRCKTIRADPDDDFILNMLDAHASGEPNTPAKRRTPGKTQTKGKSNSRETRQEGFITSKSPAADTSSVSHQDLQVPLVSPASAPIYKIYLALLGKDGRKHVTQGGVGTCFSTQIIDERHVPENIAVMICSEASVGGANKSPLDVHGVAMIPLRIKNFEGGLAFYVFKDLAVLLLLGRPFADAQRCEL